MFKHKFIPWVLGVLAFVILASAYLFQQFNYFALFNTLTGQSQVSDHSNLVFIVNKMIRLILNDLACLLLILVIFKQRKYINVAFYVFLFEVIVLLPLYFLVKLSLEGDSEISSPLLSMVHRLIINPTLMILLIAGFFYQKYRA